MESLNSFGGEGLGTPQVNVYCKTETTPLRNAWTFWIGQSSNNFTPKEYEKGLIKIATMKTPFEFWNSYELMTLPSAMPSKASCHIMKGVLKPMRDKWISGGQYRFLVPKNVTDKTWKSLLLTAIEERHQGILNDGDNICGVSIKIGKTRDEVKVWNIETQVAHVEKALRLINMILPDVKPEEFRYKINYIPSPFLDPSHI